MSAFSGEYLGFTLGDFHSSQLNITRVSNGNRYTENLAPNFTDRAVTIVGSNQTYFFGSDHTQKPFLIDFAFDDLREEDIRKLKQLFSFNGTKPLIFDEAPYKKYYVKCSSPPVIKFVPFCELGDVINYKGEGTANLVAYYPYAISIEEVSIDNTTAINVQKRINNIGDLEAPLKIYYDVPETQTDIEIKLNNVLMLKMNAVQLNQNDAYFCINTKTHLIEGLDESYNKTGTLYNSQIVAGDFFNLPLGQNMLYSTLGWNTIKFNYIYY